MIEQKKINLLITEELKKVTGCEVVKSNLAGVPIPPYPYVSFSILHTETRKGTYSEGSQVKYMPMTQTWSITVQGDDDDETMEIAMRARDWLEETGRLTLSNEGIVVQRVGTIQNRDTLLTVEYEYREGFDVVFSMQNRIEDKKLEVIEHADIKEIEKE